jgi:hypothetical protein
MKKVLVLIILISTCKFSWAQTRDDSNQVYTLKFKKVSSLEYKNHRFEYNSKSEKLAVKAIDITGVNSPEYKNHFDEIHKAKPSPVNVIAEPTKLKGPNYKNRRFKE